MITFSDYRQKSDTGSRNNPAAFSFPNPFMLTAAGFPTAAFFILSKCRNMSCFAERLDTIPIQT